MNLDSTFVWVFACVFIRATTMLLSAPIAGNLVPPIIRVFLGAVVAMALTPVVGPYITEVPGSPVELIMGAGREVMVGLIIGGLMQIIVAVGQIAGSFLDVQIGIGSAQIFNPSTGVSGAPITQLKFILSLVLLFVLDAHHLMFQAFVSSYQATNFGIANMESVVQATIGLLGQCSLLAVVIAAPAICVTFLIDAAAGLINRAVPQTQPFLLSLPAKIMGGMVGIAIGLPALAGAVRSMTDSTFEAIGRALGGM